MVCEVSLHSMCISDCYSATKCPTVPSLCFPVQSITVTKVRETFGFSFVHIHFMINELLVEVDSWVSHGLVLAWFETGVLYLVFLDSSLQPPGQEKHFGISFIPLRSFYSLILITWHFKTPFLLAQER